MANLHPHSYAFNTRSKVNWTITQEKSLATDYPFQIHDESIELYVARTYLQFLWLPESIMPLSLVVPSLSRASIASDSPDASLHPMHASLDPMLLTPANVTKKYHVELPQILANGGGAGEMEETMMWYALSNEKEEQGEDPHPDGIWMNEKWCTKYMDRMEKREIMIQILLYFLKLSLPGPLPPGPEPPKKRKRERHSKPVEPVLSPEDQLEALMDKLSMMQLLGTIDLETTSKTVSKENRDWTQIFAEDVLAPHFKDRLPDLCTLLRSKVFPSSPFSDDESNASTSRAPTPEPSTMGSSSHFPSPTESTQPRTTASSKIDTRALQRARSRSLSVSLAQEKERERAASAGPSKKRPLNREVSMSRVFKPKPKPEFESQKSTTTATRTAKPEASLNRKAQKADLGVTLVEETPIKPRVASAVSVTFGQSGLFGVPNQKTNDRERGREEEEWMVDTSPGAPVLGQTSTLSTLGEESDEELELGHATPSKPSRKRRT